MSLSSAQLVWCASGSCFLIGVLQIVAEGGDSRRMRPSAGKIKCNFDEAIFGSDGYMGYGLLWCVMVKLILSSVSLVS